MRTVSSEPVGCRGTPERIHSGGPDPHSRWIAITTQPGTKRSSYQKEEHAHCVGDARTVDVAHVSWKTASSVSSRPALTAQLAFPYDGNRNRPARDVTIHEVSGAASIATVRDERAIQNLLHRDVSAKCISRADQEVARGGPILLPRHARTLFGTL